MKYGWAGAWTEPTLDESSPKKRKERKVVHKCAKKANALHKGLAPEYDMWGGAIGSDMEYIPEIDRWRIDNGEYASAIAFCPFCGIELATLVPTEGRGLELVERRAG